MRLSLFGNKVKPHTTRRSLDINLVTEDKGIGQSFESMPDATPEPNKKLRKQDHFGEPFLVHGGLPSRGLKGVKKGQLFGGKPDEQRFSKKEIIKFMNQRDAVKYYYHGTDGVRPGVNHNARVQS